LRKVSEGDLATGFVARPDEACSAKQSTHQKSDPARWGQVDANPDVYGLGELLEADFPCHGSKDGHDGHINSEWSSEREAKTPALYQQPRIPVGIDCLIGVSTHR